MLKDFKRKMEILNEDIDNLRKIYGNSKKVPSTNPRTERYMYAINIYIFIALD